ncbi:MAG: organomercurial lyase [Candidatus Limnocylindria bacterium]
MTSTAAESLVAQVRLFIFEHFREHAAAPVVEQLMTRFSLPRGEAVEVLGTLDAARHIALVKGTSRILMAFPFAAAATPFRVTSGGRTYFANCSWDAIAFHAMLGADVRVDSYCHHCAAPIQIEMSTGRETRVSPAETLIYLALPPAQWWEDITTTCSNTMVFFSSPDHRDASDLCASAESAVSLTPDQVHALGEPIYRGKFDPDYARPGKQELLDHWAALGLSGDYWTL